MIGPGAFALLRRLSRTAVRRNLYRRLALWASTALALSSLASAAGVLGLIAEPAFNAFLVLILSTFPCVLYFPPDGKAALRALRFVDDRATLESALAEPLGSAAEPSLRSRGEKLAEERKDIELPRPKFTRLARTVFAVSVLSAAATQLLGVLTIGRPIFGYAAPASRSGRAEEGGERFSPAYEIGELESESLVADGSEAPDAEPSLPGTTDAGFGAGPGDISGLLRSEGSADGIGPGEDGPEAPGSSPEAAADRGGGLPGTGTGRPSDSSSDTEPDNRGQAEGGSSPGQKSVTPAPPDIARGSGTGWSESAGPSARNAMKDYRADFERVYTERTTRSVAAGSELSLLELETAVSRYFDSFLLRIGVEQEEDPFAAGLRAAWSRVQAAFE